MGTGQYLEVLAYFFLINIFLPFLSCHSTRMDLHYIDSEKVYGTSKPLEKYLNGCEGSKCKCRILGNTKCVLEKQGVDRA